MMFKNKSQQGFSLVELMIVVGIIGILAALAVPRFSAFQAKARQAEAKTNLGQIYTLQESRFLDTNEYGVLTLYGKRPAALGHDCAPATNDLGFGIRPCTTSAANTTPGPRYGYRSSGGTVFLAVAEGGEGPNNLVVPGCSNATARDRHNIDNLRSVNRAASAAPAGGPAVAAADEHVDVIAQCN